MLRFNEGHRLYRRLGKVVVDDDVISGNEDAFKLIQQSIIIVHVEPRTYMDATTYLAYSEWFHKVPEGQIIPYYKFTFHRNRIGMTFILAVEEEHRNGFQS